MALAIDHRAQLEDLADRIGADRSRIAAFKRLAVAAAARVADGRPGFGVLLDGIHGREALFDAAGHDFWIGRPVEQPGSRPLAFEGVDDLGSHFVEWPVIHTIKCLCFYHPDDPPALKAAQEEKLLALHDAARTVGRELLVEIIASRHGPVADDTVAAVIARLYDLGIKPDWWKLEGQPGERAWANVARAIEAGDPWCRGVVLLGLEAPEEELVRTFETAVALARRQGLRHRPLDLRPGGGGVAGRPDRRRGGDRRHGGPLRPAGGGVGNGDGAAARGVRAGQEPREGEDAMTTIRLTAAQALVRYLAAQRTEIDGVDVPICGGVWAIFGHGNVAGMGEALWHVRDRLPTYRAHNEQAMALSATAYAKALFRRRFMACTSSIGPGATNMVTAAAVAHVDRLPLLLLPGDVFASRRPDPVLQQIEVFSDGTQTVNDCFRPVSRYFDRITRAEQLLAALPRAMAVLTDPAECGPVTLSLCQDVQTEAADFPVAFFEQRSWTPRRPRPDTDELEAAARLLAGAARPLIVAGGGVLYSEATAALARFAEAHGHSRRRDTGGQGGPAPRSSDGRRLDRRHRHQRRQRARRGGRRGARHRDAAAGLYDRFARPLQKR